MKTKGFLRRIALLVIIVATLTILGGCGAKQVSDSKNNNNQVNSDTDKQTDDAEVAKTQIITDSIGREIEIPYPVTSAVVANAYNTEIINGIGALDNVIGVDYNIYQDKESWKNRYTEEQVIGKSQKELNYEKIIELNPQILILTGNGVYEEAEKQLEPFGIKVVVVDAYFTEQFSGNCELLGKVFGKETEAQELSDYFMDKLAYITTQLEGVEKKKVYFEYRRVGNTTIPGNFFFNMVEYSGADNIFKDSTNVEIDPEAVIAKNPDYIVKVSAPDVFSSYYPPTVDEHRAILDELKGRPGWDEINALKEDNVLLLSHYVHGGGSKLVGAMYTAKYLYPDLLPDLHPEEVFKEWLEKFQGLDYMEGHTYPSYTFED